MTRHPHNFLKLCSVLPALIICDASAKTIELVDPITARQQLSANIYIHSNKEVKDVSSTLDGGVFWAKLSTLKIDNLTYANNKSGKRGGVLHMGSSTKATITDSAFISNVAAAEGGAIFNIGSTLTLNNVDFIGNVGLDGGAIYAKGTKPNTITGGSFVGNKAAGSDTSSGGAIYFELKGKQLNIDGTLFENNSATNAGGAMGLFATSDIKNAIIRGNSAAQGGGLFLGSSSHTTLDNVVFDGNTATETGGAIKTRIAEEGDPSLSSMTITNGEFKNNTAKNGGAIHNSMTAEGAFSISGTSFSGNKATQYGGAIYNLGNMTVDGATFADNSAFTGGAVHTAGGLSITNTTFENNGSDYLGGAVNVAAGTLNLDNVKFLGNHSQYSGAIFTYSSENTLNIKNSLFEGNWAEGVGAIQTMYNANIENTVFRNNRATKDSDGGGAMFVGAVGKVALDTVTFEGNTATERGGAISTRSADLANNQDARLDILNSVFTGNVAGTTGGALDNYLYSSVQDATAVYIDKATFAQNKANAGGAIYNHGEADKGGNTSSMRIENSSFMNNVATTNGGAIYNASGLTLAGDNVFSGNIAGNAANDIHNTGTVAIESGTTTIGGGITGDGTLSLADGATLNLGTAKIEQGALELNGTILASIKNANSFGKLYAESISGTGTMRLTDVYGAGRYHMFGAENDITVSVDADTIYTVTKDATDVVVSLRPVDEIADANGIDTRTAAMTTALLSGGDRDLAARAQKMLTDGNGDQLARQVSRAHPDNKPVMHSVTATLQNQVLGLSAGRMAGAGRAGGDTTVGYGAWAQGLFNKSKFVDQFHSYTRGIAFGADTLINRVYTLGVGYAYNTSDVHANDRDVDIDGHTVFVYGQYKPGAWYANTTLSYSHAEYSENTDFLGRSLTADYDVDSYGAQVMTGYDFASGITPELGVRYLHMSQDDYSNALMSVSGADTDFLAGVAGLKYAFDIQTDGALRLRPELHAAATYDFLSDDVYATVVLPGVASYRVNGDRLSRMGGEFGLGLVAEYNGLQVSLNYDLDLHRDYTSHTGMLKLKLNF